MHDIKWIRANPEAFDKAMMQRGLAPVSEHILQYDQERREEIARLQSLQERSNEAAKRIGQLKASGQDAAEAIEQSSRLKAELSQMKEGEGAAEQKLNELLASLPNMLGADVPQGDDEADNKEIYRNVEPQTFPFTPKDHDELGRMLGVIETEQTAAMSGARFATLTGALAKMERGLINFMLDIHTREFGYQEVSAPMLVREGALYGTSQLPKFEEDLFKTTDGRYLIPTAEVSLTNLVAGRIIPQEELPMRLVTCSPCFRSEAGSAGRDTKGLIRMHQFYKVELVSITDPAHGEEEHERLTDCAQEVLRRLELPYRVVTLCSGDTGFGARKTYDLEVWLPGQHHYREISSCSHFGDFQARRMNARTRAKGERETHFVHTLNGSALALSRTIVAIMENYQNADGNITIPHALRPYMGGMEKISQQMT